MPGKKKSDDLDLDPADHCPTCGVKLNDKEKREDRCRNGHALTG
jgi:hypothetical protein